MEHQLMTIERKPVRSLVQATVRLRADQKDRLVEEMQTRGGNIADVLRDNLDLAFAIKAELSKVVEGEYDENDPKNAPRLVHSLLFRVEERMLGAFEELSKKVDGRLLRSDVTQVHDGYLNGKTNYIPDARELVEAFISLIVEDSQYSTQVWLGAFLELIPRLSRVDSRQIKELEHRGIEWLDLVEG